MVANVGPAEVQRLFRSGVEAVVRTCEPFGAAEWDRPACGDWTAAQTARHLAAVAGWYHEWLDRGLEGDIEPAFAAAELPSRNEAAVAELSELSGPAAVELFVERATGYVDRLDAAWVLPYSYPFGVATAGLHCGVAAAEWHLHAWDLSGIGHTRHVPDRPGALFTAAGLCVAHATGGVRGSVLRRLVPLGARIRPWPALLKRSGRTIDKGV